MRAWGSEVAFLECLERLDWEVHRLDARNTDWSRASQRIRTRQDKSSRAERAFTFIYVAGALESLFRDLNFSLAADLHTVEVRPRDLRPAALSLLVPNAWDAINSDRVARMVRRRDLIATANDFYASADPLELAEIEQLGLTDGRTVTISNFEALWDGLCLSPFNESVWLSNQHRQAIVSLADKRNAIAHFDTDPRIEAFRFSYGDLHALVIRVQESVERLRERTILWLEKYAI